MLGSSDPNDRYLRRAIRLIVVLALAATGCGSGTGEDGAAPTETTAPLTSSTAAPAEADPSASNGTDWCPAEDAVATVVGHAVTQGATGGFSGFGELSVSYSGCSYRSDENKNENDYDITRATIETEKDGQAFDLLDEDAQGAAAESGFNAVADLGDDAYLDGQTLVFRNGDTMVLLEVTADDGSDLATRRDTLAKALTTIDLSDDEAVCTAPADAMSAAIGPVSGTRSGGGGLSIDDISIATTSCTFEAEDGTEATISVADADSWDGWVAANESTPFNASYTMSTIGGHPAFDNGSELFVDDGKEPLRIASSTPDLSRDDAIALRANLAELVLAG